MSNLSRKQRVEGIEAIRRDNISRWVAEISSFALAKFGFGPVDQIARDIVAAGAPRYRRDSADVPFGQELVRSPLIVRNVGGDCEDFTIYTGAILACCCPSVRLASCYLPTINEASHVHLAYFSSVWRGIDLLDGSKVFDVTKGELIEWNI